jgi:hypothetical protein
LIKTMQWQTSASANNNGRKSKTPTPTLDRNVTVEKQIGTNREHTATRLRSKECRPKLISLMQARKIREAQPTTSFQCSTNKITEVKSLPDKTKTQALELLTALKISNLKETGLSIF